MSSKNAQKIEKIVKEENKQPPKMISNQSQTSDKEEQKELNSDKEKIYLEGEPHIDTSSLDTNKLKEMKQITVKPRETYLKEKISKINFDSKLINNIQKDMTTQVSDIKTQINDNKVIINDKTKDLNKIMKSAKIAKEKNLVKYSDKEYLLRKKHKILKELREEQNNLKLKLNKIESNEALLKSEGFINLNNSYESNIITPYDKSIKQQEQKNIKHQKNLINERLKEIEFRIGQIMKDDKDNQISKKEKLESYKQNFERDKELIEARAEKYLKETKERNKRIAKDMEQLVEKRKKEIEIKEKEEKKKKKELIEKFKEKEKKIERQRLEEKKLIMVKYMPFRKIKLDKKEEDYNFAKMKQKYIDKEQNLLKKINDEKKMKSKMLSNDELQNFWEQIDIKKEENKKKKEIDEQKEREKFEAAKNFKPKYVSKYNEQTDEEVRNVLDEKKIKKEYINGLNELKINFAKKKVHQPKIDEGKKKERVDAITKLENPKLFQIKYTLKKPEKNKIQQDKKSMEWLYKLKKNSELKNLNNSAEMNNPLNLIKKPKVIKISSSFTKNKKENVNPKQFNYLEELRNKKKIKPQATEIKDIITENNETGNLLQDVEQMKIQTERLDRKAEMGEEILKINGGISNNPKLGKELSDLYINSIGNKLKILNKVYETDN